MKKVQQYTIFLTTECNLRCRYCFVHLNQKIMSPSTFRKIFDFIYGVDRDVTREICLLGGEPLLAFNLIGLIPKLTTGWNLKRDDIYFAAVPSNGQMMNDDIISFFAEQKALALKFTAHSFQSEENLRSFSLPGSQSSLFSTFVTNVKKYRNDSGRCPRIVYVVTPSNVHRLYDFVKYFAKEGFNDIKLQTVGGEFWNQDAIEIYMKNFRSVIKFYQKLKIKDIMLKVVPIDNYLKMIRGGQSIDVGLFSDSIYFSPSGDAYVGSSPQLSSARPTFNEKKQNEKFFIGNIHEGIDLGKRDALRKSLTCQPLFSNCTEHFPVPCETIRSFVFYGWDLKTLYNYVSVEQRIIHEMRQLFDVEKTILANYAVKK